MRCGDRTCEPGQVRRDLAVQAVCRALGSLVLADEELVADVVKAARELDAQSGSLAVERDKVEKEVTGLRRKIAVVVDVADVQDDDAASNLREKLRSLRAELNQKLARLAQLKEALERPRACISPEQVRARLRDMASLLDPATWGGLSSDQAYEAADLFRRLVGGHITVKFTPRAGRKRTLAEGTFVPGVRGIVRGRLGVPCVSGDEAESGPVTVALREPPRVDRQAEEARRLYEDEKVGFREIGRLLGCGSGNACLAYRRCYEMWGLPVPPARSGRGGRPRKA
jgi:hypothetical protein